MHPHSPETEIELQLYQQKSFFDSVLTAATDSSGTGVQSTKQSTKIINSMRIIIVLTLMRCR